MNWRLYQWIYVGIGCVGILMVFGSLWFIGIFLIVFGLIMAEICLTKELKNQVSKK